MSSTTERSEERGQILVLFAAGLAVLFVIAAIAFDVGMVVLERRDQQNAADAAALAGARYVLTSPNFNDTCAAAAANPAANAACEVALANDFDNATASENVFVHIPAIDGEFKGFPGFVQVQIEATRSPIFAGILGRNDWAVGTAAVAANQPGVTYTFGMIALDPEACKAIHISGTGTVNSAANVQSNSNGEGCGSPPFYGLSRTGGGILNVTAPDATCRSVGGIQDQGSGTMTCTPAPFSFALPDPLADLPAPVKPPLAAPMVWKGTGAAPAIPAKCPGASPPPSEAAPALCKIPASGGPSATAKWLLYPGLYPGGLEISQRRTAYLMPGIYWIGGGGFKTTNDASVISVESDTDLNPAVCTIGATPPCTGGGGVLIYNTSMPGSAADAISLGGGGATLKLQPYQYPFGATTIDLVIFQDRTVPLTVVLNGSNSQAAEVRGIVYVPAGEVQVNGSNSVFNIDQVIANTFKINGSGGTINVLRETGVDVEIQAVGLVE